MEKTRRQKKKYRTTIVLVAVVLCVLLFGLSSFLIGSVQSSMWNNSVTHIMEMTSRSATVLATQVEAEVQGLSDLGKGICLKDLDVLDFLLSYQGEHGASETGVVGMDGKGFSSTGMELSAGDTEAYQPALRGESLVSKPFRGKRGTWQILIQVPILQKREIIGALYASFPLSNFYADYSVDFYRGRGYSHTVNQSGALILAAQNDPADVSDNLLDYLRQENEEDSVELLAQHLQNCEAGNQILTYQGEDTFFGYVPVGNSDNWSVISIIPCSAIQGESQNVIATALAICTAIIACFMLVAYLLIRNSRTYNRRLLKLAYTDPVTGETNFSRFKLDAESLLQKNPHGKYAVFYTDIKNFKYINDVYGFENGDRVLKHFSHVFSETPKAEIFARLSGDTFVSLHRYNTPDDLRAYYEALRDRLCNISGIIEGSASLTIYTGIYRTDSDSSLLSINEIIDRANIAQKNAKRQVVGGFEVYTENVRRSMLEEQEMENQMEPALKNGEFVVYLQPKYSLKTGKAAAAEALVRWNHPEHGLIPPGKFIPLFERNGFIQQLDTYMFEQVCVLLRRWIDEGRTPLPISVNVSRYQLNNAHFLQNYFDIRDSWRIPDQLIEIEFTESLVFENTGRITDILNAFHAHGFLCSIDDFGAGYSSLNLLKDLPVDTLKLDKVFFDRGQHQEREHIIIRSVLGMARKLSMQTVAEGIELPEQVDFLKEAGCELVQGFVFDRPMSAAAFEEKYLPPRR